MPDNTDLVSAIGTWVAVGLAILALVGIVAPVLVWKATKSERNRAINALDESGAETFGYVGRGLWTPRKVRIFRRIRAPLLRGEPVLHVDEGGDLLLKLGAGPQAGVQTQPTELSADWVQFGSVVEAYGIDFAKGDPFVIEDGHVWLPTNTSWLLLVGLLGRYGHWHDKGRLPATVARGTASTQASVRAPGKVQTKKGQRQSHEMNRLRRYPNRDQPRHGSQTGYLWKKSAYVWEDHRDRRFERGIIYWPLYGLTGAMYMPPPHHRDDAERTDTDRVFFSRHKASRVGNLDAEALGVDRLFWMAVGCIPWAGNAILCLADAQDVPIIPETPSDFRPSSKTPSAAMHQVRFQEHNDDSSSSDDPIPGRRYRINTQVTPAMYVPQQPGHPATTTGSLDPFRPRAFEFSLSITRIETLSDFADIVHAESPNISVFSLKELELTDAQVQEVSSDNDGTYIARQSGWLRLEAEDSGYRGAKFLRRSDGQRVAAALLKLPLSPYGYLMSLERSLCRAMLCETAHALPQLLTRTMWSVDDGPFAHLDNAVRENLRVAMADFYQLSQPAKPTRLYFEALFKLDTALNAAITGPASASTEQDELVALSMGCVMVTSPEFRSLVAQSARLLVQGFDGKMSMDMVGGQVKLPTVLNFVAEFPVDLDDIAPHVAQSKYLWLRSCSSAREPP